MKKTMLDFYNEVWERDKIKFNTNLGVLHLNRYSFEFLIGEHTRIHVNDMCKFPYPKLKMRKK